MKYYDNYIDNNNNHDGLYEKGILKVRDNDFYVNNELVIGLNRCMEGDSVVLRRFDSKIVNVEKRQREKIVGILLCDSKYKFGKKDGKKNIYMFQPTKYWFPLFYVASSHEYGPKRYCVVEFKSWTVEDKYPWGEIIETIGIVGNKEAEYEHLRCYYGFYNNHWKLENEFWKELCMEMNNMCLKEPTYNNLFSIDPIGCEDIDDAFHICQKDETIEIGVHIASPTTFFENYSEKVLSRVSTIYLPHRKINMLPSVLATSFYSLLPDKVRPSVSFVLVFDRLYNLIEKRIEESSLVSNKKAYDYDEFQEKIMNNLELNNSKQIFCKLSNHFFNKNLDSHTLVEEWMLYINTWVAETLIDPQLNYSNNNAVLRVQPKPLDIISTGTNNNDENYDNNSNNVLNEYLKREHLESAKYIVFKNNQNDNCTQSETNQIQTIHSSLNKEYYTHFTSPIRRSIDFWNHLLLRRVNLTNPLIINEYIDNINDFMKRTRKLQRMIKRLEFLFKLNDSKEVLQSTGYIVKMNERKIRVYIPEYELEENIYLYNYKSFVLLENFLTEKNESGFIKKISYSFNGVEINFELYQTIKIQLFVFPKEKNIFQKCKLKIIS